MISPSEACQECSTEPPHCLAMSSSSSYPSPHNFLNNITLILNSIAAKSFALYAAEKGSAAKIEK